MVQLHPDPPGRALHSDMALALVLVTRRAFDRRGRSSAGRAPALHAGGQEFDPPRLHHSWKFGLSAVLKDVVDVEAEVIGIRPSLCGVTYGDPSEIG